MFLLDKIKTKCYYSIIKKKKREKNEIFYKK